LNAKENDPDTLQILDEQNEEWTKRWRKATSQDTSQTTGLTIIVPPQEKARTIVTQTKARL